MMLPLIAIDGPAGAGKSSTAREVARRLGIPYLDTGALYRAVAWHFGRRNVNLKSTSSVVKGINECRLFFAEGEAGTHVWVQDEEVTRRLRSRELTTRVGPVCEIPEVREWLVELQRRWAQRGFGVIEGRDIGTVVLPGAALKLFLTARPAVRAERRGREIGIAEDKAALTELAAEIDRRDKRDAERSDAPMKPAEDAVILDTSDLSFNDQVQRVLNLAGERFGLKIYGRN
ncbi:MAG TPA: (d)CMP kinase [Bacteroidetes bacterium]|nr:(d)CMP kinase [Bacteroidota bacterium]